MRPLPILIALLLAKTPALAQQQDNTDSTKTLQEVIIGWKPGNESPGTVQTLRTQWLEERQTGQEPSFILAATPSVTAYSDAGNTQGYSYLRLRGIDQSRINISLDGVPLNEPEDQGAYFSNYPDLFNSLSAVQLQRGVGVSRNGVASYGGSIQMSTNTLHDTGYASFGLGYGSFNSYRAYAEYNSGMHKGAGIYARASALHADGYKYHAPNSSSSMMISGELNGKKSVWKTLLLAGRQQNGMAWLGVTDSAIKQDRRTNSNTAAETDKFMQYLLQVSHTYNISRGSTLQTAVYGTHLDGGYSMDLDNFLSLPSSGALYGYAFRSALAGLYSNYTYEREKLRITTGIHGNTYARTHTGTETTAGELYVNTGRKYEASAFARGEYSIKRLTLAGDVQYRQAAFSYTGDVAIPQLTWHFVNPKGGLSYKAARNTVLYYSMGATGCEPARNDMFGGNDNLAADSAGKAMLYITHPEYVTDHELGLRHRQRSLHLDANLFYMAFRNEIVLNGKFGPNGLALTDRVDRSYRTGAELSATLRLSPRWWLANNSGLCYSRISQDGISFAPLLTPQLIVNQDVIYTVRSFSAGLSARYQSSSYIDFANTTKLQSYVLLNARAQYATGRFVLMAWLNNITNERYYNNGYIDYDGSAKYFVQAPVNYNLSVKYTL